jgi:site-specific recombinase XerD
MSKKTNNITLREIKSEKNVSPHTFRAYTGDISQFITFLASGKV